MTSEAVTGVVAVASGLGGASLGALLARRNNKRAHADRLLVDALNEAFGAVAEVAHGAGRQALASYASAVSRIALHGSPAVVTAFRKFQDDANTGGDDGRARLLTAVQMCRRELGHERADAVDLSVLLFGPRPQDRTDDR